MVLKAAERGHISPFIVMDVMRAANAREAAGGDVLHLEVGQPGTSAPEGVLAAAERALRTDRLGYTDSFGIPELRQRIAGHYRDWYGMDVVTNQVIVTTGSSGGFSLAFLAAFDPGDRVAIVEPGYPAYRNILEALGVEVVGLAASAESRFQPDVPLLESSGRIDGLIIASPANPTGTMVPAEVWPEIVDWCRQNGVRLISDEIYHGITYDTSAETALAHTRDAIIINSFSKYFSMTGWRLGWMVVPEDLMRQVECLAQNLFISPPTLSQLAAVSAFDCHDELQQNLDLYVANRTLLLEELPKAGFTDLAPVDGAFYIYADIRHLTNDSKAFCQRMLAEGGVAATPGLDFDPARGQSTMRFSFAGPTAEMAMAAARLSDWLR
jgi:aspartate/methionine/tyrosine aminotransferase